ncbi:hypothetical protein [Nocardia spumae]|uniref:hypothetical protein n=1 Tax=Nocardia spumae TaxID=2887190 RepID=UPI001D1460C4|nr:hypothetical protein [Nocardia spumae]
MSDGNGYTVADLQRMREEMEISARLHMVEQEHKMRQLLGDDVYRFMRGEDPGPGESFS